MKFNDLPPTMRRFALHSPTCSMRMVSNVTGIPAKRVKEIRAKGIAFDWEIRQLARFFGIGSFGGSLSGAGADAPEAVATPISEPVMVI